MILQTRFDNGTKGFTSLGDDFSLVEKEVSPDEFNDIAKRQFGEGSTLNPHCYAFIFRHNGASVWPLYKGFENVLLNESGGLFKNLTFK